MHSRMKAAMQERNKGKTKIQYIHLIIVNHILNFKESLKTLMAQSTISILGLNLVKAGRFV